MSKINTTNLLDVIQILWRWRKQIGLVCLVAGIGSILISLLLTDYYKSTTIVYPVNPEINTPSQVFGKSNSQASYFGSNEDVDRVLSLATSVDLVDHMIQKFNLYKHYEIDSTNVKGLNKVRRTFKKYYEVSKNKYGNIEISIEDWDRDLATSMVNEVRFKVDDMNTQIIKLNQAKLIDAFQGNINYLDQKITSLTDSLTVLQKTYGIYSVESQGEILASLVSKAESGLARETALLDILEKGKRTPRDTLTKIHARIKGYQQELKTMTDPESTSNINLGRFRQGLGKVASITGQIEQMAIDIANDRENFSKLKAVTNSPMSSLHILEVGKRPDIKSRPFRSYIVLGSIIAAFVFSLIGILLIEANKHIEWQKVFTDE